MENLISSVPDSKLYTHISIYVASLNKLKSQAVSSFYNWKVFFHFLSPTIEVKNAVTTESILLLKFSSEKE